LFVKGRLFYQGSEFERGLNSEYWPKKLLKVPLCLAAFQRLFLYSIVPEKKLQESPKELASGPLTNLEKRFGAYPNVIDKAKKERHHGNGD
jgi:hypothetical protein